MSEEGLNLNLNSMWKKAEIPRGKHHNKTETKTTVSLYLSKNLVQKAKKHGLNLSRITEEALSSILTYIEAQNTQTNQTESSIFLSRGSFQKESRARSSVRIEHRAFNPGVPGSNLEGTPFQGTIPGGPAKLHSIRRMDV